MTTLQKTFMTTGTIAIIGNMEKKTINGQEYSVGQSLEVIPSIDADGSSVKLNVMVRLNVVNSDSTTPRTPQPLQETPVQ